MRYVQQRLRRFLRVRDETLGPIETAGGDISAPKGLRMRVALWDIDADWVAMKDGSAVLSMGERCWENDYTFVWVMRRYPCFLFEGTIVILDVDGVIPIWHPEFETSGEMLGAFKFCLLYTSPSPRD